jgi:hypothetical protein
MGIFDRKRIGFKQTFIEKYRLTVTSNVHTGNMPIESKMMTRWELKVKSINEDYINFEVITLDSKLVEYNNQIVKSMADMNQIFAGMYSELDLTIDRNYNLVKINNRELLEEKWNRIKSDLENVLSEEPEIVSHVINLNDKNFENPDVITDLIRNNEFFLIYFHHVFGKTYPSGNDQATSKNILNTAMLDWDYLVRRIKDNVDGIDTIGVEGFLRTQLNRHWIKENYKAFSHLDLEKIKPEMREYGEYQIEVATGKIVKAFLEKKETVHPKLLHATIRYDLESEEINSVKTKPSVNRQENIQTSQQPYNPEYSFIIDD